MSSDSDDKLSAEKTVNNYDELKTAITNAADGDTIILNDGIYEFPSSSGSTIVLTDSVASGNYAKSLTFKGATKTGVIINYSGSSSIFTVNDNYNLTLQNLNFNSISSTNPVVFANGAGNCNIIDCTFTECKSGWGIVRTGTSFTGQFNMNGATFLNCEHNVNKAAGVVLLLAGTAKFNINNVVIDGAKITVTTSMAQSKWVIYIVSQSAEVTLNDLTIKNSNNIKTSLLYVSGTVSIKNSCFMDNNVSAIKLLHINSNYWTNNHI